MGKRAQSRRDLRGRANFVPRADPWQISPKIQLPSFGTAKRNRRGADRQVRYTMGFEDVAFL